MNGRALRLLSGLKCFRIARESQHKAHKAEAFVRLVCLTSEMTEHWQEDCDAPFSKLGLQYVLQKLPLATGTALDRAGDQLERMRKAAVKKQIQLHKSEVKDWAATAVLGHAKQAHQYLKRQEGVPVRPFPRLPFRDRAEARRQYWVARWGEEAAEEPLTPQREHIRRLACEQAEQLKRISSKQIQKTLQFMSNKKGGLDGFDFRELKNLPPEGYSGLAWLYDRVEKTGRWPQQALWVLVACLPKTEVAERPIGLLAVTYRLHCRIRKHLLLAWQKEVGVLAHWDRAVLGGSVMEVACVRQLRAEAVSSAQIHMCAVLSDLRHFFDSIDLQSLAARALQLKFPPLLLHHLHCVRSSPRILVADEQISEQIVPKRGIVAGCPMATSMAKIFLWDIVAQLIDRKFPSSVSTWVDDLGMDVAGRTAKTTAARMVTCYKVYCEALEINGLQLAKDKSGFLASSKEMKKELKTQLATASC